MKLFLTALLLLSSSFTFAKSIEGKERFVYQGSVQWNLTKQQFYNGCSENDKKELLKFTDSGALEKCYQKYNNCEVLFNRVTYAGVPYDPNHGSVCDAESIATGQ